MSPGLADEPEAARGRAAPRRDPGDQRQAGPGAAGRLGCGPGGRGAGRAGPGVQPGRPGHAPGRLPAGRPRPVARVARPVRLRRPQPRHRRAGQHQRPDPGPLPDEQPVRDPPGRGRRRVGCWRSKGPTKPPGSRLAYERTLVPAADLATEVDQRPAPSSPASPGATRRTRRPGPRSARPSSRGPSSVTSTESRMVRCDDERWSIRNHFHDRPPHRPSTIDHRPSLEASRSPLT